MKDNPAGKPFIEVVTKALRREPVSGETLLTLRQQLRRLRASAFDLPFPTDSAIARLNGVVNTSPRARVIRKSLLLVAAALQANAPERMSFA